MIANAGLQNQSVPFARQTLVILNTLTSEMFLPSHITTFNICYTAIKNVSASTLLIVWLGIRDGPS